MYLFRLIVQPSASLPACTPVPSVRIHIIPDAAQAFTVVRQPLPVPSQPTAQPRAINFRPPTLDENSGKADFADKLSELLSASKMVSSHPTIRRSCRDTLSRGPDGSRLSQPVPSRASLLQEKTPQAWSLPKFVKLLGIMITHLLTRIASPWACALSWTSFIP